MRARGRCTPERPRFADAPFVRSWRELVVGTPTVAEEMGCGASKDASSAPKEPIAPKKKNASKLEGAASAGISGVDATAAVTVAAGAATIVAGATSDGARGALGQAASAAGGALLNFAKELPWVAPIAFLVAGVVEAAANVHALKRDAQIFAANVQSVENVMVDAARKGHLSKVEETCMALQFEMEEGLAFCHKLKTQYFVTQMLMSGRDCQKFKDISDSMHRQVTIIAAAASIAVHDIVMEEYEQGAQLADKIAELGGPAAVAADPEKKAACQEFMTASDALLHGAVDEVQRAVRAEAAKSQKKMDMLMEQSRAQTKVLEDQVANLTKMMEVLLATRVGMSEGGAGVDLSRPDGRKAGVPGEEAPPPADDATVDRALETGITGDEIRDVMRRMPVADTEAERLEVVDKYGLNTDEITDLIGDEDLRAITDEGREAFGVTDCWVGTIDRTRQTYVSYAAEVDGVELPRGDGHWWPNIASACKHVIKKGDVLQSNGSIAENAMEHMANLSLPEYQALAEAGHAECKNVFPVIGQIMSDPEGKMPNEQLLEQEYNPHGEKGTTYGAARTFLGATLMSKEVHYSGAPIKIEGQTVATFCVIDRTSKRQDVDAEKMRAFAARAGKILKDKAVERGFQNTAPA